MGLPREAARREVALAMAQPERIHAYLRGESFPVDDLAPGGRVWALVSVDGYPLGWGKIANGTLKNDYPIGLRRRS
jgi:NOL1/NOP2/fmu family ribosome biogenesis protein